MNDLIEINDVLIVHANEIKIAARSSDNRTVFITLWGDKHCVHGVPDNGELFWLSLCKLANN